MSPRWTDGPMGWCAHSERFRIAAVIDSLCAGADCASPLDGSGPMASRRGELERPFALGGAPLRTLI